MRRVNPYDDPLRQLEVAEFNKNGCGACAARIYKPDGRGYRCENNQPGFPDESRDTCRHWQARCHAGRHD